MKIILIIALFFESVFTLMSAGESVLTDSKPDKKYKIAVCDWMILKRQKIGEFALASELEADGIEMDMGGLGKRDSFDNKLKLPEFQKLFPETARKYNMEVPSVAMSGFYAQSFVARNNYVDLVADCINTMKTMGAKVAFLPLGVTGDLNAHPEIRPELISRLQKVGQMAVDANVVIGIETSLCAKEEVKLLRDINSDGIKIYFNFQNPLVAGRDIYKELKILGRKRICQIHCTDTDEFLLQDNKRLDMHRIKKVLDKMHWSGWLVVERSRDINDVHNIKKNYGSNIKYLKSVFYE